MIVVVIMAILVAVAIPVYVSVTKNVEARTCIGNCRVISGLLTNYINGVFTGAQTDIPNLQIHKDADGQPVFTNADGSGPDADVAAIGAWLLNQEQDSISLCCVGNGENGGVLSAEIIDQVTGRYVRVTCDKHSN